MDGLSCITLGYCPDYFKTWDDAVDRCTLNRRRLCTMRELLRNVCCGTGGGCDSSYVWSSTSRLKRTLPPTQSPTDAPTPSPTPAVPTLSPTPAVPTPSPTPVRLYYIDDGCRSDGDDKRGAWVPKSGRYKFGVRCCSMDGLSCITLGYCPDYFKTWDDAVDRCRLNRRRLCTMRELLSDVCCGTGGSCDSSYVWTSTYRLKLPSIDTPTPSPTDIPTPTPTDIPTPTPETMHYIDDGCQSDKNNDMRGGYVLKSLQFKFGVRCCSMDGSSCITIGSCPTDFKTVDFAVVLCRQKGRRLCTKDELLSNICCDTGGYCDSFYVWTSTFRSIRISAPTVPTPSPTDLPTLPPTPTTTDLPTAPPTSAPTPSPTDLPTSWRTPAPSVSPTDLPTAPPTPTPTDLPTALPTAAPSASPTDLPTLSPTPTPTDLPTAPPTPESCIKKRKWTKEIAGEIARKKCPSRFKKIFFGVKACKSRLQKRLNVSMANQLFGSCKDKCVYDYKAIIAGRRGAFMYIEKTKCYKYYSHKRLRCFSHKRFRNVYSQAVERAKKLCR